MRCRMQAGFAIGLSIFAIGLTAHTARTSAADPGPGKRLAFLVGINNYRHAKLDSLQYAERDAEELAVVLKGQGYTVQLLTPAAGKKDERLIPTRENIDSRLAELLRGVTRDDQILVALAGHGIQPDGAADGYFCPVDANPSVKAGQGAEAAIVRFPETLVAITGKEGLLSKLDSSGVGRKLLLIDACRNDPESGRGRGVGSTITQLPDRTWLLLSCSARQRAWETGKLGGGHGVFFHFVLEGLRGKASGNDGRVTWQRLAEFVIEQVEAEVPKTIGDGAVQLPDMKQSGGGVPVLAVVNLAGKQVSDHPANRLAPSISAPSGRTATTAETTAGPLDAEEISNSIGMKLRRIPAGEFLMGSPASDSDAEDNEKPQHRVRIAKPFYMGKFEVTQREWKEVMDTSPWKVTFMSQSEHFMEGDDYPAGTIDWLSAVEFCKELSKKEKKRYRLPTEAEWEYACRGNTTTRYHFGDTPIRLEAFSWYSDHRSGGERYPHRVGLKRPNPFGLHDMLGNVEEWCSDYYYSRYLAKSPTEYLHGPATGSERVYRGYVRGGDRLTVHRSAARFSSAEHHKWTGSGFRVVMDQ